MKTQSEAEKPEAESSEAPTPRAWSTHLGRNVAIVLLVLWTLLDVLGLAFFKVQNSPVEEVPSPEIALGDYQFRSDAGPRGAASAARFSLHVAFTPQMEHAAREQLALRKHRLQQDVEELLRRAQGTDFEDPRLRELKRQVQEQINETLGMRAVADVIITGLAIEPGDSARKPNAGTLSSAEKPGA